MTLLEQLEAEERANSAQMRTLSRRQNEIRDLLTRLRTGEAEDSVAARLAFRSR